MSDPPAQPDSTRVNEFVAILGRHQLMLFRYIVAMVPRDLEFRRGEDHRMQILP